MMEEKTIHDVTIPTELTEQMVRIAKYYVTNRVKNGFTIQGLCKDFSISSKTWSAWKKTPVFSKYLDDLNAVLVPQDVMEAVRKFKSKVLLYANKETLTKEEFKQFYDTFNYAIEYDNKIQAEKLGMGNGIGSALDSPKTWQERRDSLLAQLRPDMHPDITKAREEK